MLELSSLCNETEEMDMHRYVLLAGYLVSFDRTWD